MGVLATLHQFVQVRTNFLYICLLIWLGRRMSRRSSREKINRQMYGKLKELAQQIIGKLHPSNLVYTIFYLVF